MSLGKPPRCRDGNAGTPERRGRRGRRPPSCQYEIPALRHGVSGRLRGGATGDGQETATGDDPGEVTGDGRGDMASDTSRATRAGGTVPGTGAPLAWSTRPR